MKPGNNKQQNYPKSCLQYLQTARMTGTDIVDRQVSTWTERVGAGPTGTSCARAGARAVGARRHGGFSVFHAGLPNQRIIILLFGNIHSPMVIYDLLTLSK